MNWLYDPVELQLARMRAERERKRSILTVFGFALLIVAVALGAKFCKFVGSLM